MCYDDADGTAGRQEAGPESPSRRAFSRLLLAGTGLAALSACTPAQSFTPSGTPGPTPGRPGSSTPTAAPRRRPRRKPPSAPVPESTTAAAPTPSTASPVPPSALHRPPSAAAPGPQHSLSDPTSPWVMVNKHRPLSPATFVPPDLVRPAVRLATSGEAALLNSTTAAAAETDVRGRGRGRRHHHPGQRVPFVRDAEGHLRRLREFAGAGGGRHRLSPAGLLRAPDGLGVRHRRRQRSGRFHAHSSRTGRRRSGPRRRPTASASWSATRGCCTKSPAISTSHGICASSASRRPRTCRARGIGTLEEYFGLEAAPAYL